MNINIVRTKADYQKAVGRIEVIFDAEPNTRQGDELEILGTLVHAYEEKNFPIEAPDPIEFIKNVMEFKGLSQTDLAELLESRSRASELLSKTRALNLSHIRKISAAWDIPVEPLIGEYELETA